MFDILLLHFNYRRIIIYDAFLQIILSLKHTTSIIPDRNASNASAGEHTIGSSCLLKDVLTNDGSPVSSYHLLIKS
mgnify:CR=1 FL=1